MKLSKEISRIMLRKMLEIRKFEEKVLVLYKKSIMPGMAHLYIGEEAVAVGTCTALNQDDYITSTHRGHGHSIAKGGQLKPMMAELLGRTTGYCKGKGGSMHIADFELGILGANGIVGGGFGTAIGAALSAKMLGQNRVSVSFFGDASTNQGSFHECVNLASVWKLPVVFVCENNGYGISVSQARHSNIKDVAVRAASYGIPSAIVDGMDVIAVYNEVKSAVDKVRKGAGPILLECKTYRFNGHSVGDPGCGIIYRTQEEMDEWIKRCPIIKMKKYMLDNSIMTETELENLEKDVEQAIEDAVQYAIDSPFPGPEELLTNIYA